MSADVPLDMSANMRLLNRSILRKSDAWCVAYIMTEELSVIFNTRRPSRARYFREYLARYGDDLNTASALKMNSSNVDEYEGPPMVVQE